MSTTIAPPPAAEPVVPSPLSTFDRAVLLEERVLAAFGRVAPTILRVSLAGLFIWFGALKVAGVPTLPAGLIAAIVPFVDPSVSVPAIGAVEVVLGIWLLTGWRQPLVLAALMAHLAGTLLVLVVRPDVAFQGANPLLLSVEGEFVVKNVVLMASIAVLAGLTSSRALVGARKGR